MKRSDILRRTMELGRCPHATDCGDYGRVPCRRIGGHTGPHVGIAYPYGRTLPMTWWAA